MLGELSLPATGVTSTSLGSGWPLAKRAVNGRCEAAAATITISGFAGRDPTHFSEQLRRASSGSLQVSSVCRSPLRECFPHSPRTTHSCSGNQCVLVGQQRGSDSRSMAMQTYTAPSPFIVRHCGTLPAPTWIAQRHSVAASAPAAQHYLVQLEAAEANN